MDVAIYFLCALIIALSVARIIMYYNKTRKYYRATGIVVDQHIDSYSDLMGGGYTHYYPIVEFIEQTTGESKKVISSIHFADSPGYKTGSKVQLLIHPEDTSRFIFENKFEGYGVALVWILIAIGGIIGAGYLPEN